MAPKPKHEDVIDNSPRKAFVALEETLTHVSQSLRDMTLAPREVLAYREEILIECDAALEERNISIPPRPKTRSQAASADENESEPESDGEFDPDAEDEDDLEKISEDDLEDEGDNPDGDKLRPLDTNVERPPKTASGYTVAWQSLGWKNGKGDSKKTPMIIGGTQMTPDTSAFVASIPLNEETGTDDIENKKARIRIKLQKARLQVRIKGRKVWVRLHPYAIEMWIRLVLHEWIGLDALKRIKSIVSAAERESNNSEAAYYVTAKAAAADPANTNIETQVLSQIATAIQHDMKNNNFRAFIKSYDGVVLATAFNKYVGSVRASSTGTDYQRISKLIGRPTQGNDMKTWVMKYLDARMKWPVGTSKTMIGKWQPVQEMVATFSAGFLLLIDHVKIHQLLANGCVSGVATVAQTIAEEFPEFLKLCRTLYNLVVIPLVQGDAKLFTAVTQVKLKVGKEGESIQERIESAFQLRSSEDDAASEDDEETEEDVEMEE